MTSAITRWRTVAHETAALPEDWRMQLAVRLGQRPRRVGLWAELALYGARRCLDAAGEATLPAQAVLCVASLRGPVAVTRATIDQLSTGLPMPFSFLQSQPSQMLAALCQALAWQGDARFMLTRDAQVLRAQVLREAGPAGALLGWVDEGPVLRSEWWRLVPERAG
jgi:hypothetical protein